MQSELRAYYDSMRVLQEDIRSKRVPFQKIDDVVNVYGVVIGFTSPSITRQGDYMVSITMVDQSLPLPPNTDTAATDGNTSVAHITLVIFSKNRNKLPKFQSAGDVLRAHAVVVQVRTCNMFSCILSCVCCFCQELAIKTFLKQ
jgi:hypothetical protein